MKASVIVCTYNRASYLQIFLRNFTKVKTDQSDYEIILIDDGSTDETGSVITQFLEILPIKHFRFERNLGKEQAVFFGISKAESENILFTDDDCLVDSNWINAMVIELGSFPLVAGRITTPTTPIATLVRNISEFHQFMGLVQQAAIHFLAGANMGIRHDVMIAIGDLPSMITSFDTNIAFHALEKGYSIYYSVSPVILHSPQARTICGMMAYEAQRAMKTILLRYNFRKIVHTPFYLQSSWIILLFSPIIALGRTI